MGARRKLSPQAEAAIMRWHSQYQQALEEVRKLGSYPDKAKEFGISERTVHTILNRDREKVSRILHTD